MVKKLTQTQLAGRLASSMAVYTSMTGTQKSQTLDLQVVSQCFIIEELSEKTA